MYLVVWKICILNWKVEVSFGLRIAFILLVKLIAFKYGFISIGGLSMSVISFMDTLSIQIGDRDD